MININNNNIERVILYESFTYTAPERTEEQILNIVKDTNPDLILRAVPRRFYINDEQFNKYKSIIQKIHDWNKNTLVIGNLFFHFVNWEETDDITGQTWTKSETWSEMARSSSPLYNQIHRWWPDLNKTATQDLYVHAAERILNTGADGIWIDGINSQSNGSSLISILNRIKDLKTLSGKVPIISTWSSQNKIPVFAYDFLTKSPTVNEIKTNIFDNNRWKNDTGKPIIAYIDWGFTATQLYYFGQLITDFKERKNFQINFLNSFYKYLLNNKEFNTVFSFPVHGGVMCWKPIEGGICDGKGCNVISENLWFWYSGNCIAQIYDSKDPIFDIYSTIKEIINPSSSKVGIGSVIILGILLGIGYKTYNNRKKKKRY